MIWFKPVLKYVHMLNVSEIWPVISWFSFDLTEIWHWRENIEWRTSNQSPASLCKETVAFYPKECCANNQACFTCHLLPVHQWNTCFLWAFLFGVLTTCRVVGFHFFFFLSFWGHWAYVSVAGGNPSSSCMVSLSQPLKAVKCCLQCAFSGAAVLIIWDRKGEKRWDFKRCF